MVLGLAFILLVSLVVSAVLSAFGDQLGRFLPSGLSAPVLEAINFAGSLAVISLLFAAIFKILPDAKISWRDVRVGAVVTGLLFVAGKFALGLYLGHSNPGEAFGAAGALALMLVWIYYSSMIVLLGAEFTQVWAEERGSGDRAREGGGAGGSGNAAAGGERTLSPERSEGAHGLSHARLRPRSG